MPLFDQPNKKSAIWTSTTRTGYSPEQIQNVLKFALSPCSENGDKTYKRIALFFYIFGWTYDQITNTLQVGRSTVSRVVNDAAANGCSFRPVWGGNRRDEGYEPTGLSQGKGCYKKEH